MRRADEVLAFWFAETEPARWFGADPAFDEKVRMRFGLLHEVVMREIPAAWVGAPRPALAAVIVLDQFSRNIHRGTAAAFAGDSVALALAHEAVERGWDAAFPREERLFLYLPFEHSEAEADGERAVALIRALGQPNWTDFAERHLRVIRRFGRYPARNAALGRDSTADELAFLAANPLGF